MYLCAFLPCAYIVNRAPESLEERDGGHEVSLKTDVFMFAGFMLECLTGLVPFHFNSTKAVIPPDDPVFQRTILSGYALLVPLLEALPKQPYSDDIFKLRRAHPDLDPLSAARIVGRLSFIIPPCPILDMLVQLMHDCFAFEAAARPDMGPAITDTGGPRPDTVLGRLILMQSAPQTLAACAYGGDGAAPPAMADPVYTVLSVDSVGAASMAGTVWVSRICINL